MHSCAWRIYVYGGRTDDGRSAPPRDSPRPWTITPVIGRVEPARTALEMTPSSLVRSLEDEEPIDILPAVVVRHYPPISRNFRKICKKSLKRIIETLLTKIIEKGNLLFSCTCNF